MILLYQSRYGACRRDGRFFVGVVCMEVIINFNDGDVEAMKNIRSITNFETGLELRGNDLRVTRYERNEIRSIEIIWR